MTGPAIHGKATGVILGVFNLTRFFKSFTITQSTEAVDATMFQAEAKEYVVGQSDATVSMGGRFVGSAAGVQAELETAQGAATGSALLVALGGWLNGARVRMGAYLTGGYDVAATSTDIISTAGSLQSDGGLRGGVLLGSLSPVAAVTPSTGVDNGLASTAGGRLQVHVLNNTRSATTAVVLQHSTNGSTWVDLYTLSPVPAGTVLATAVNVAGTINRYVRTLITPAAGAGAITLIAALARNN